MMVDVHLTDARTVLRFTGRKSLITLILRDPATLEEHRAIRAWLDRGQGEGFQPSRIQFIRKANIAWIEQVPHEIRDAWLAEHAPEVLAEIRRKESRDPVPPAVEVPAA